MCCPEFQTLLFLTVTFAADEGAEVDINRQINQLRDYKPGLHNTFTGKIIKVTVEQK